MDIEKLKLLSEKNDIKINNHKNLKRTPPFYYDSLRQSFGFYFNTFITKNWVYDIYAYGDKSPTDINNLGRQLLDEDNTVLSLISLQRFFELFIKDILKRVNHNLVYEREGKDKKTSILLSEIESGSFKKRRVVGKLMIIPFRKSLNRFYDLVKLSRDNSFNGNKMVKKFKSILKKYSFLEDENYRASLQLLNWYRDRILHKGDRLPSLWFLDYLFTQRFIPIIHKLIGVEKNKLGNSLFYLETITGINIIDRIVEVKFEFNDIFNKDKIGHKLMYIGHLKELGRANLNMNLAVRNNYMATYEYNYKDPKGRGRRFAIIEEAEMSDAKEVKKCPCCGEDSLVRYEITLEKPFGMSVDVTIQWLKCYTCDYHLRYNAYDPHHFNLASDFLFRYN